MTPADKRKFIKSLCDSTRDHILGKVDAMPDNWDGHELRRYIADEFEHQNGLLARGRVRDNGASKRLQAYRSDVMTRPL